MGAMMSPQMSGMEQAQLQPSQSQGGGIGAMMTPDQMPMSPMQAAAEQNAGTLQQIRQTELTIAALADQIAQMSQAYPAAAEDSRKALQGLDAARQALTGFVVSVVSQMPTQQPPGPAYMGS